MPRPSKTRRVHCSPQVAGFKPCGVQDGQLERVILTKDELEAIRLADYEGLYQEQAAETMNISRQTFGNIIASARGKVADFLLNPRFLLVEGGNIEVRSCRFVCSSCEHSWTVPCGSDLPHHCPHCGSSDFYCGKRGNNSQVTRCWRIP